MTSAASVEGYGSMREVESVVGRFERCALTREEWDHRAHLTVAMWYLGQYDEATAANRMIAGIRRFNHATGIRRSPRGGYHETLTLFWLGVGRRFVARLTDLTPLELVNRFLHMPKSLPYECYSEATLWSCEARCRWVEPDLMSIDDLLAGLGVRVDFRGPNRLDSEG